MAQTSLLDSWRAFLLRLKEAREGDEEQRVEADIFTELRDTVLGIRARGGEADPEIYRRGALNLTMDEAWTRGMETRMVRVEEQIKVLAPITLLREMIDPLKGDLMKIATTVEKLAESDLELKEMHKGLMVERAQQEEARHKLELQTLREKLEEQRTQAAKAREEHEADLKNRGVLAWVSKKAHPLLQFIIAVGVLLGLLYGLVLWIQAHYK